MKTCRFQPLTAAAGILFAVSLLGILGFGLVYLLAQPGLVSESEHQQFFLGACMLCFAGGYLIRRCLYLTRYRVEYDDFSLCFHFPGGAERILSWYELPHKVTAAKVRSGWQLAFLDDGRTYLLHRRASGYRAFARRLQETGVLP